MEKNQNKYKNLKFTNYQAPREESLSKYYSIYIENSKIPVYKVKVAPRNKVLRYKACDDVANSHTYFEEAAFAYFDLSEAVNVKIEILEIINNVKILPESAGIIPVIKDNIIHFKINNPQNLTIEINNEWIKSLHLFANPKEIDIPDFNDPNVIYFGPGIHEVSDMLIKGNQTVYIAGGAIVKAVIKPEDESWANYANGRLSYAPTFKLKGNNIKFRGRGIIDGSLCTTHARFTILTRGSNIDIEGIIIRDASWWTIYVRGSEHVKINNIKLLGYRANSDGIDICNSRYITVENSFIRTLDDLIVIKTVKNIKSHHVVGEKLGSAENIIIKKCVLWNQIAHSLSLGAEIVEDITNVLFIDCDIIHDIGREWSLRIYHCDSGKIDNIVFENIRISKADRCISLWLGKAFWSTDSNRGQMKNIIFKDIKIKNNPRIKVELIGFNKNHIIENIKLENILFNGNKLEERDIIKNEYIKNIDIN